MPIRNLVEAMHLFNAGYTKIEKRFSRRTIRKRDIRPQVSVAVDRMVDMARLREFSIANGFNGYNGSLMAWLSTGNKSSTRRTWTNNAPLPLPGGTSPFSGRTHSNLQT
jgi:hypothetical protein